MIPYHKSQLAGPSVPVWAIDQRDLGHGVGTCACIYTRTETAGRVYTPAWFSNDSMEYIALAVPLILFTKSDTRKLLGVSAVRICVQAKIRLTRVEKILVL